MNASFLDFDPTRSQGYSVDSHNKINVKIKYKTCCYRMLCFFFYKAWAKLESSIVSAAVRKDTVEKNQS